MNKELLVSKATASKTIKLYCWANGIFEMGAVYKGENEEYFIINEMECHEVGRTLLTLSGYAYRERFVYRGTQVDLQKYINSVLTRVFDNKKLEHLKHVNGYL